jgi:hypothetical protein
VSLIDGFQYFPPPPEAGGAAEVPAGLALVALEAGLVLTADVGEAVLSSSSSLALLGAGAGVSSGAGATTLVAAAAVVATLLGLHL